MRPVALVLGLALLGAGSVLALPSASACGDYFEFHVPAAGHVAYVGFGCGGLATAAACVDGEGLRCPQGSA